MENHWCFSMALVAWCLELAVQVLGAAWVAARREVSRSRAVGWRGADALTLLTKRCERQETQKS